MSQEPPPKNTTPDKGIPHAVGLVFCATIATISLMVAVQNPPPAPPLDDLKKALETPENANLPIYLTNLRHEEPLWDLGGKVVPHPPWKTSLPERPLLVLAHDPGSLPGGEYTQVSPEERHGMWFVRQMHAQKSTPLLWEDLLPKLNIQRIPKNGSPLPCQNYHLGRWKCGDHSWNYVGLSNLSVDGKKTSCLWAHPYQNETLRITLPKMERPKHIRGRAALSDQAAKTPSGTPVRVKIRVGTEMIKTLNVPNQKGWKSFTLPATHQKPGRVSFEISTQNAGRRFFCLDLGTEDP